MENEHTPKVPAKPKNEFSYMQMLVGALKEINDNKKGSPIQKVKKSITEIYGVEMTNSNISYLKKALERAIENEDVQRIEDLPTKAAEKRREQGKRPLTGLHGNFRVNPDKEKEKLKAEKQKERDALKKEKQKETEALKKEKLKEKKALQKQKQAAAKSKSRTKQAAKKVVKPAAKNPKGKTPKKKMPQSPKKKVTKAKNQQKATKGRKKLKM